MEEGDNHCWTLSFLIFRYKKGTTRQASTQSTLSLRNPPCCLCRGDSSVQQHILIVLNHEPQLFFSEKFFKNYETYYFFFTKIKILDAY